MRLAFKFLSVLAVFILTAGQGRTDDDKKTDNGKKDDNSFERVKIANYPTFTSTSAEPVLLRYKLKTGQTLRVKTDLDINMLIKQGKQTADMKMPIVMEATAGVRSVDSKGNMLIDMKITRMKLNMDMSGIQNVKMEFDSDKKGGDERLDALRSIINVNVPCKITPTGQLLESDMAPLIQALEQAGNAAIAAQMKDTLSQIVEGAFVQLSEKPVKAGEIYKGGTLSMGSAKAKVSYKVRSVSGDKTQVVLEPVAEFDFSGVLVPGADIKVTKQDFGGWMVFDVQKGYASKGEGQVNMLLDIRAAGESGTMTMKAKTVVTQTLK